MSTTWEQLEGAALAVTRSGSIKDRLVDAFRNHIAQVETDELPEALRVQFKACHETLTRERPMPGEDAVRATVRKMSNVQADEVAASLVRLYGAYVRETTRIEPQPNVVVTPDVVAAPKPRQKKVPRVISLYGHDA
ncbi:MAG: hypothetical protein JSS29_00950 [Proteobacteria bacterium]|nr:hypothetical protein [Pseudomonadota bacterium]